MFVPTAHGFQFANAYPAKTPVFEFPTPFGVIPFGDAAKGLCGGMVFAALDLYRCGTARPEAPSPALIAYFGRRLLASWDIPFGVLRYYDWMCRSQEAVAARTANAWRAVKARLDAGHPAPLGLVKAHSADPRKLGLNHQVLACGYSTDAAGVVTLRVYDPNYLNDDSLTLCFRPGRGPVTHSAEGPTVRGLFLVPYRKGSDLSAVETKSTRP